MISNNNCKTISIWLQYDTYPLLASSFLEILLIFHISMCLSSMFPVIYLAAIVTQLRSKMLINVKD